jgi:predicted transcriptional regulator
MLCSERRRAPLGTAGGVESRLSWYVERLALTLGHADRTEPFRAYCTGLILPGERKCVEPIAARVEPGRAGAAHQSLHHFVAKAAWNDAAVLAGVRELVLPTLLERGPIRAWIIDDTGMPKKGRHSLGVTRQYCGQIGKQDNCQAAVSLSLTTDHASLPVNAIAGIGHTTGTIRQVATFIASAIEEQGAATAEISRNVQEAASGTQLVSANIITVSQAANQTGAAAAQVLGASSDLAQQSVRLKSQVEQFLSGIRAA